MKIRGERDVDALFVELRQVTRSIFFGVLATALVQGALGAIGFAWVCYQEALAWARERHTFGKRLADHQVVRHRLVDMLAAIESARAMLEETAWRLDHSPPGDAELVASLCMLKNVATRCMQFCADAAVQTLGGMGYMRGTKSERIYREVKVNMIGGGAEEIMKDLAARQLGL